MKSEVFFKDNIEGMKQYPDNYFDLAVVDPNCGIKVTRMNMGTHKTRTKDGYPGTSTATKLRSRVLDKSTFDWDNEIPPPEYFTELFRVSKNQIIWCGNYFHLPPTRCFIIWNKNQPWEDFSQAEYAWTSFDKPAKLFTYSNRGGNNEVKKIHPTEKPIYLYDYCFKHFATEGMKILDTHLGSGNSRISADKYKLEFVGFENNEIHFNDHLENYRKYKSQFKLQL